MCQASRLGRPVLELANRPSSEGVHLALDGNDVYWTASVVTMPGGATAGSGALSRVAKDGSGPSVVLVSNLVYPAGIFVTPQFVYWAEFALGSTGQSRIMRMGR